MQKIQKNAYILLWSIFLSLIIGISFLSITSQISKNLKENSDLKDKISTNNKINNKLNEAIENNNFDNIELNKNELIIFEKNNFYNIGLKNGDIFKIQFNTGSNLTIKLNYGTPVELNGSIVSNLETFTTNSGTLFIKNLGGYSNIDIISEKNFLTDIKKYKIIKKIGNKNVTKQNGEIKLLP